MNRESELIRAWFDAAVRAADPTDAVLRHLSRDNESVAVDGHVLPAPRGVIVVGVGKAAPAMVAGIELGLGDLVRSGLAITKEGHDHHQSTVVEIIEAAHPIPDDRSVNGTRRMLGVIEGLSPDDLVIALISGGGSALLEAPRAGLTLEEIATTTNLLLRAGAPIQDLNAVRIPLSRVKGGGLRRSAWPARFVSLLLSDVLGNVTSVIASGPTVYVNATSERAIDVLSKFVVQDRVPASVINVLRRGADRLDERIFVGDIVSVIADNAAALAAVKSAADVSGIQSEVIWRDATGEAREKAIEWVAACESAAPETSALLGGGELTVTVRGDGVGGRNTEFAVAAAIELERRGMNDWTIGSLATDGQDARTGVAGGILHAGELPTARRAGVDPIAALQCNDSLRVLRAIEGVVEPGPTGTNVNDLYFALRRR